MSGGCPGRTCLAYIHAASTLLCGMCRLRSSLLCVALPLCRYALGNMGRIWTESAHSLGRKATLTLEFMYLTINLIFGTW